MCKNSSNFAATYLQKVMTIKKAMITMKKRILITLATGLLAANLMAVDADIQIFYDFGSKNTVCDNQRGDRVTTTVELFHPDKWGSTFFFVDFDYSLHNSSSDQSDPKNSIFGAYWEITRNLNFWQNTKAKDLSVHVEYDGGLGIFGQKVVQGGYGINHAVLVGPEYFLHTADYKNTFNLQLLFKYIADDWNMWKDGNGNLVPLQFTFLWSCRDFCTASGLTFTGFIDIWGQKLNVFDRKNDTYTDPTKQSFVFISEPQLWYAVGQHFKCPNLCIGTEIEFSYNFTGKGFMCNPCVGIKWMFL